MRKIILNLFEGEAPAGAAGAAPETAAAPKAEKVVYGKGAETQVKAEAPVNAEAPNENQKETPKTFDELIKGEYKKDYEDRVQKLINKRFKAAEAAKETVDKLTPAISLLQQRYKVNDIDSLVNAINNDSTLFEEQALAAGMEPEQYKEFAKMQAEMQRYHALQEQERAREQVRQQIEGWRAEAETLKSTYPELDFDECIQNPEFVKMMRSGVSLQRAYVATNFDKISGAMMQAQAKNIEIKKDRPIEGAAASQTGIVYKSDVSKLTAQDRKEIARRAARGELISF